MYLYQDQFLESKQIDTDISLVRINTFIHT